MQYKYPPLYKYGFIFIVIYAFLRHQQIMASDKLLINALLITSFCIFVDYVIIKNHPQLFETKTQKTEKFKNSDKEIEDILNAYDASIETELIDDEIEHQYTYKNNGVYKQEDDLQDDYIHSQHSHDMDGSKYSGRSNGSSARHSNKQYFRTDEM